MFFTMTAAIGGGMAAATWLIQDGPAVAASAGIIAGAVSAAGAAALLAWLDRRSGTVEPAAAVTRQPDDLPRLPHRRRSVLRRFARRRHPEDGILAPAR